MPKSVRPYSPHAAGISSFIEHPAGFFMDQEGRRAKKVMGLESCRISCGEGGATLEFGLSLTALWVGYYRIREASVPSPLFFDPLAKALMKEENAEWAFQRMQDALEDTLFMSKAAYTRTEQGFFPVRTRFIDDHVDRSLYNHALLAERGSGGQSRRQLQVVDIACGFDARAFRLNFPDNTVFFEVDRAEVIALKTDRLAHIFPPPSLTCAKRVCIPADILLDDWEADLVAKGFEASLPTVWICEGILTYLPEPQALAFLARVRDVSAPGSTLVCDVVNDMIRNAAPMRKRMDLLRKDGAQYNLFISNPVAFWKSKANFSDVKYHLPGEGTASYGRIPPHPFLRAMRLTIRVVISTSLLSGAFLCGYYLSLWVAVPVMLGLIVVGEGWALLFQEWLALRLTMTLYPVAYFTEVSV
ncbi:hypothetical protein VYU27_005963 [Nannochloropsis oceanica]